MAKIKILICTLMMLLVCGFGIGCSYAYTLQPDGNLKSDNLIYPDDMHSGYFLNSLDGSLDATGDSYNHSSLETTYFDSSISSIISISFDNSYLEYSSRCICLCFYNDEDVFISSTYLTPDDLNKNYFIFDIPSNATNFKLSLNFLANLDLSYYHFMLNLGFPSSYESYGSKFYSQSNYEQLQSNYNILQQNYTQLQNEYNSLLESNSILMDDYQSLRSDYNLLEEDNNTLKNDYNDLQTKYDKLEQNYVLLQNDYNSLLKELNIYNNYVIYGWGSFIDSLFVYDLITDTNKKLSFQELIDGGYLKDNVLNLSQILNAVQTDPNHRFRLVFTFNENFDTKYWFMSALSKTGLNLSCTLVSSGGKEYSFKISYYPYDVNLGSNYDDIKGVMPDTNIKSLIINGNGVDSSSSISLGNNDTISFSSGYSNGYQNGYNNGSADGYNNGYSEGEIVGYNKGVQEDFSTSGFTSFLETILSYPVNMVKNSLNFEFMGINIANLILFIVSIGIIVFVIKKFR